MMAAMEKNPGKFAAAAAGRELNANGRRIDGKKKPKRSRQRVERPKQRYLYANQRRRALEQGDGNSSSSTRGPTSPEGAEQGSDEVEATATNPLRQKQQQQGQKQLEFHRSLGINPMTQVADAAVGDGPEEVPRIVARVRVDGESGPATASTNSFAYVVYKPAGWSILGDKKKKGKGGSKSDDGVEATRATVAPDGQQGGSNNNGGSGSSGSKVKRVKAYDEQTDDFTFVEYSEADVLAVLTPEERAELLNEGGLNLDDDLAEAVKGALEDSDWDDGGGEEDDGLVYHNALGKTKKRKGANSAAGAAIRTPRMKAIVDPPTRPSLLAWLKQLKASESTPIKGGKNWVALAGATEIDDSGLVLLCPRDRTGAVHVDGCGYVAVVGNEKKMSSRSKLLKTMKGGGGSAIDKSTARINVLSRLKRGRDSDPVLTVDVGFPEGGMSTCSHAVLLCQERLNDGVRGDALTDPLGKLASRRLVHCESMAVTSLANLDDDIDDDSTAAAECPLPDDIATFANRRDGAVFNKGSFLGRQGGLAQSSMTNAYREINGAADGFPGWIVDRYDRWLFVQHHEEDAVAIGGGRGPLPSLHDGFTTGVYYLPTKADRSIMGSERLKPALLEGQAAPEFIPIKENGINYLVNLGESFSSGLFLDQRPQRAYLSQICDSDMRVLNCFAHAGGFSVAAAASGAKTVSLDLDKKWLDRIRPQMEANGITEWEGVHDCIYGDCFDWLARLAKRGEQFDVVILDPPSTSVGKKKKRWSVRNDMAELVSLAAPLVKSGGLLFTTTNSATLSPEKFAKMCHRGLADAGAKNARLERVCAMPSDFGSVGMQPVKNLVWRIP